MRWSNDASANGSDSADASTSSTRWSKRRPGACASISGLWSTPVTRKPRRTSSAATSPVPVATSSTWPPSCGRREARNRRQRGPGRTREPRRPGRTTARAARRASERQLAWAYSGRRGARGRIGARRCARRRARQARGPVSGILATEAAPGRRVYLCSLDERDGLRSWLAVTARAPHRSPTARSFAPPHRLRRCVRSPRTTRAAGTSTG